MDTFPVGAPVTLSIPFTDASGNAVVPTGGVYLVLDELEAVAVPETALVLGPEGASITIPGSANVLPPPITVFKNTDNSGVPVVATSGLREVRVTFATPTGPVEVSVRYMLGGTGTTQLYVMQNSFQPFNQALMVAAGMPNLDGWVAATDAQRQVALVEAYGRLTKLGYYVRWPLDPDAQNYINWGTTQNEIIIPRLWTVMTIERWQQFYPEIFRASMRKAQIAEASQILGGDLVRQKRQDGIISEKTGESSMMFRSRKPLDLGISPEAMAYLTGFVDLRMQITRA